MKDLTTAFLSEPQRREIETCVRGVEKTTSGEIVPMVVSASYHYPTSPLLGGLILGALSAGIVTGILTWQKAWGGLSPYHLWVFPAVLAAAFLLFHLLIRALPPLARLFISAADMEEEVAEAALTSFYRRGLQSTRDRTGILLYISVFERRACVLADEGINAKVSPEVWNEVVDMLVQGIHERRQTQGICAAVRRCGELVRTHFPVRPDDTDELKNLIVEP